LAENTTARSARSRISWITGIAAFFVALITWGTVTAQPGASWAPELALDLQGGTQLILTPSIADGQQASLEQLHYLRTKNWLLDGALGEAAGSSAWAPMARWEPTRTP